MLKLNTIMKYIKRFNEEKPDEKTIEFGRNSISSGCNILDICLKRQKTFLKVM